MAIKGKKSDIANGHSSALVTSVKPEDIQRTFESYTNLVTAPLGSRILSFSDEWFAAAENLLNPAPPVRKIGVFTHAGAWYDGWETRRHNPEPFDWVVIRLGVASGRVAGVEIDTAFFDGNHAPEVSVQGVFFPSNNDEEVGKDGFAGWKDILERQECGPNQRQAWKLAQETEEAFTHVRLCMWPDGGIARFRLFGTAQPVFPQDVNAVFDLAATVNGGLAVSCSDQHFGRIENLLLPGRGKDMGDGWETKRTRGQHVDWVVIKLGTPGSIEKLVVDTAHFRGNFPKEVQVFAAPKSPTGLSPRADDKSWIEVLSPQTTGPDKEHEYGNDVLSNVQGKIYAYVKLVMIPDGGIKRIRVFGKREA